MHIERYVTFLAANDLLLAILNLAALGGVLFAVIRSIMWVYRFVRDWWHSSLRSTWRAFKLRLARHSVLCADSPTYYLATVTSGLAAANAAA